MHKFNIEETVVIKYGPQTGESGVIKERQKGLVYKLQFPNGKLAYYTEISLIQPPLESLPNQKVDSPPNRNENDPVPTPVTDVAVMHLYMIQY